ncbi:MAG: hypothetical protein ACRD5K_10920 [Candidatus Acidiferrales bacterium]
MGDELYPRREPDNPFAEPGTVAVALFTKDGKQVGYLPSGTARPDDNLTRWTIVITGFYNKHDRGSVGATLTILILSVEEEAELEEARPEMETELAKLEEMKKELEEVNSRIGEIGGATAAAGQFQRRWWKFW